MNYLRLSLITCALMLALALPAFAGHMETTVVSPSPTPSTGEMGTPSTAAAAGDISCPGISADPAAEIALSFIQSVLALF